MAPRNPGSDHEDKYPGNVMGPPDAALSDIGSLGGPDDPGLVDPFQDPEFLSAQLPDDEQAEPGTGNGPTRDESGPGSGYGQGPPGTVEPAAGDLEADGTGSDAPSEDEDRFDAG